MHENAERVQQKADRATGGRPATPRVEEANEQLSPDAGPDRERPGAGPVPPGSPPHRSPCASSTRLQSILWLQQNLGNAYVQRVVAASAPAVPTPAVPSKQAPPPPSPAGPREAILDSLGAKIRQIETTLASGESGAREPLLRQLVDALQQRIAFLDDETSALEANLAPPRSPQSLARAPAPAYPELEQSISPEEAKRRLVLHREERAKHVADLPGRKLQLFLAEPLKTNQEYAAWLLEAHKQKLVAFSSGNIASDLEKLKAGKRVALMPDINQLLRILPVLHTLVKRPLDRWIDAGARGARPQALLGSMMTWDPKGTYAAKFKTDVRTKPHGTGEAIDLPYGKGMTVAQVLAILDDLPPGSYRIGLPYIEDSKTFFDEADSIEAQKKSADQRAKEKAAQKAKEEAAKKAQEEAAKKTGEQAAPPAKAESPAQAKTEPPAQVEPPASAAPVAPTKIEPPQGAPPTASAKTETPASAAPPSAAKGQAPPVTAAKAAKEPEKEVPVEREAIAECLVLWNTPLWKVTWNKEKKAWNDPVQIGNRHAYEKLKDESLVKRFRNPPPGYSFRACPDLSGHMHVDNEVKKD